MPFQECACAVDGASLQLRRPLPRKHRDLGIGRQRGDVDRDLEWMRRYIVWQHKHRRLAGFREVARHAVHEVGPHAVEAVQIRLNGSHRHIGPAVAKLLGPDVLPGIVHVIRLLRQVPYRLAQDGGDHARRRAFHQLHPKRAADAIAEEKNWRMPRWSITPSWSSAKASQGLSTGTGPPLVALRWSMVITRKSFLNSSMMLITAVGQMLMREFKPPPGVASSGWPEPISAKRMRTLSFS